MAAFQELAFHDLKESIELCEKSDLKLYLADGLRRMGNVFVELDGLAKIETADGSAKQKIQNLIAESAEFIFSADDSWEFIGSAGRKFSELNLLEKAQRLCEASYLEADALDQFHESFEGITHAASVALRLRRREDVNRYVDYLELLHGYAYQQDLHIANMEIILGHLAFDEQRVNDAADKYVENFRVLADLGGYARRVLELQAQELEQRLKNNSLSQAQRKDILQRLDQAWTKTPVAKSYPRLIFAIRSLLQQLR